MNENIQLPTEEEKKLEAAYAILGRRYLEFHRFDPDPRLLAEVEAVRSAEQEIARKKNPPPANGKKCPGCGLISPTHAESRRSRAQSSASFAAHS